MSFPFISADTNDFEDSSEVRNPSSEEKMAEKISQTTDFKLLKAALLDGREVYLSSLVSNPHTPGHLIEGAFIKGNHQTKMAAVKANIVNRDIDLARLVSDADDVTLMANFIALLADRNQGLLAEAEDILRVMSPSKHNLIWNILEAKGLLMAKDGQTFSFGAKTFFMCAAFLPQIDKIIPNMIEIVNQVNDLHN
jgi:hypothetical protein